MEKLRKRALARYSELPPPQAFVQDPVSVEERRRSTEQTLAELLPRAIEGDREARQSLRWIIVECLRDKDQPLPELARLYLLWALGDLGGPELQALQDMVDTEFWTLGDLHLGVDRSIDDAFGEKRGRGRDPLEETVRRLRSAEIVAFLAHELDDLPMAFEEAARLLGYSSVRSLRNFCGREVESLESDRDSAVEHTRELCSAARWAAFYFLNVHS